jgi:hypothetical protein
MVERTLRDGLLKILVVVQAVGGKNLRLRWYTTVIRKADLTTKGGSVLYEYSKYHRVAMPLAGPAST